MSKLEFIESVDNRQIQTWYADIILPVAIPKKYTYRIPRNKVEHCYKGSRVIVQFGKKKIYTGIVAEIHNKPPQGYEAKLILEVLDDTPLITETQLVFFEWVASYYMCTLGEVIQAALPSGLKLNSESSIQLHPEFDFESHPFEFTPEEEMILRLLKSQETLSIGDIGQKLEIKNIQKHLRNLSKKDAIIIFEKVSEKYAPKKEKRIVLHEEFRNEQALNQLLETLSKSPKQESILLGYYQTLLDNKQPFSYELGIPYSVFTKGDYSISSVNTLIKKKIFDKFEVIIPRIPISEEQAEVSLSEIQNQACEEILKGFESNQPVLLHGITGSGKTEIYLDLINKVLESGQQVLFLLPEIAITTQIIARLSKAFGRSFGVYHSKYSDNERIEIWNDVLSGRINFVVGVRSSIFLPFSSLGLIIVDEEHETSYKQHQPAPRYHARDTAIYLSKLHHAAVLLGTATPSIESYFNAISDKYKLIELTERYGNAKLPQIQIIDQSKAFKKKQVKGEFSDILLEKLVKCKEDGLQSIIFQNRRGYSPLLNCMDCGWVGKCIHCSVSLTYHQYKSELKCHYCGFSESIPQSCPDCGSTAIKTVGFGTQKLEEDLTLLLPDAQIQRMDLDTTRSKSSYENIISAFEHHRTDILVGTQMVTKGLDFDKVQLVGIVDFDRMLHFPDFRAAEKSFQMSIQVAGRAGRRDQQGEVIIQSKTPDAPVLRHIVKSDWKGFYAQEIEERKQFHYPPFVRLLKISIKHSDKTRAFQASRYLGELLRHSNLSIGILGPEEGLINRIKNKYIFEIMIKFPKGMAQLAEAKQYIQNLQNQVKTKKEFKSIQFVNDVDPI